ncbi:hypothetical protein CEXT_589441 [Caerostris extrusa]|uniref:Uncharacterized protein n=1 Tax=Caerostris extrusa TaxID=172846 RepID=A0AAV4PCC8_CAEEX|nr:hypothetical protein CEXT_589441 [Caerostris extrusa]
MDSYHLYIVLKFQFRKLPKQTLSLKFLSSNIPILFIPPLPPASKPILKLTCPIQACQLDRELQSEHRTSNSKWVGRGLARVRACRGKGGGKKATPCRPLNVHPSLQDGKDAKGTQR